MKNDNQTPQRITPENPHYFRKDSSPERDYICALSHADREHGINTQGTLSQENAYGEVFARDPQHPDGIPVVCGHGGSMWLCRKCAEDVLRTQCRPTPPTVFPETEGEDRRYYEEGMELLCDRLDAERRATIPPATTGTPRTDACVQYDLVPAELARTLERDLAAARKELEEACNWIENRLAVEGHPVPASMSLLVGWRKALK